MGNTDSNPVKNIDKRTARREYHQDFSYAIEKYRDHLRTDLNMQPSSGPLASKEGEIVVCVRKRPINKSELSHCEFDVITPLADRRTLVIHDARMGSDMKTQYIEHYPFRFNRTFGERDGNETVYGATAASLIDIAFSGKLGTCMMYGQTGSGKTYTMTSFFERVSADIFDRLAASPEGAEISVSFVEIAGDYCFDLLNEFAPVELLQVRDGGFQPWPVAEPRVHSARELLSLIEYGCGVRTTAATGVHDASSRSHAVLRVYVRAAAGKEGILSLIDLAGSEHRIDSMYHSSERRTEGAEINASLAALKDCIRAKADSVDYDNLYRRSKLTQLLKSAFIDPQSQTVVVVCVSPSSKDTEHTLNSLRYASVMENTGKQGSNKLLSKNRRGVVSTVDTGLGPKKNPFSVWEMVDGEEVWTLQHIKSKEMGYQYIGMINVSALAREKRQMRQNGTAPELRTNNGNNKVHVSPDDSSDNRSLEHILRQRRSNCRRYEGSLSSGAVLQLLDAARAELGRLPVQNRRLWQNPRTKLLKALAAVGLSRSPMLGEQPADNTGGRPKAQPPRLLSTPQRRRPPVRRRASDGGMDSDTECGDADRKGAARQPPHRQRSCSPIQREGRVEEEGSVVSLPRVAARPPPAAAKAKPKAAYSENGWSRPRHQTAAAKPTTPGKPEGSQQNIAEVVPKSEIKPKAVGSFADEWTDDAARESGEQVVCSIVIDGKMYDNVNISRASVEAALRREALSSRRVEEASSRPISTTRISSRNRQAAAPSSARPTSAHAGRPSKRSHSPLPFRGVNKSSDDFDDSKYTTKADAGPRHEGGRVVVAGQPRSAKASASPRVSVRKSKTPVSQRRVGGFDPSYEPSPGNVPEAFQVQRGVWSGAAGGPGWIGLDQPYDSTPAQSKRSSASVSSNRASVQRESYDNASKWKDEDNPFVSRRGKIRNTNECSAPSNVWTPDMAYERYGDMGGRAGGGMFARFG